eukprot:Partr_v1_DN28821_c1_g1_i1_m34129 putative ATP-binding cassette, sub-family C (CFTR MRP), member
MADVDAATTDPVNDLKAQKPIPETQAWILSHWFYNWLTPFILFGYRHTIEPTDLYDLADDLKAASLAASFASVWESIKSSVAGRPVAEKGDKSKVSVTSVLWKQFGTFYSFIGFYHLLQAGANIASPVLVGLITQFAVDTEAAVRADTERPSKPLGYLYAAIFIILQIISSVVLNRYFYHSTRISMQVRISLTAIIYRKMIKLSSLSRQKFSSGRILNMVSSDLTRIEMTVIQGHYIWSGPLQVIVILILLILNIGVSALAGVGLLIILIPVQGAMFIRLGHLRQMVAQTTDSRVRLTQEFLQGMRIIKLFAWEESFLERIMKYRTDEVRKIQYVNMWTAVLMGFSSAIPILASVISFVIYAVVNNGVLNTAVIFSSLALFNLLRFPMILIPNIIRSVVESNVALKRISDYLNATELVENTIQNPDSELAIEIKAATFRWEVLEESEKDPKEKKVKGKDAENRKNQVAPVGEEKESDNVPEKAGDVPLDKVPVDALKNINIKIKRGQLVAIVGAVGSGKTSLLNAILGEMKSVNGTIGINGKIGYSLQQPWVQNGTLLKNITFGLEYDEKKYNEVIRVTSLEKDIQWLPAGNDTLLGEKGVQISGGQKARVSLARVVYGAPDIVLLDDPISAVDVHVGRHIFKQCVKKALKGKTVLLVTHHLSYLREVDFIIVMKDGMVEEQGSYAELMASGGECHRLVKAFVGDSKDDLDQEDDQVEILEKEIDTKLKQGQLMLDEERSKGSVAAEVYLAYLKAAGGIWTFIGVFFILLFVQATRIGNDLWLVGWTEDYFTRWSLSFNTIVGVYLAWGISQGVATAVFGIALSYAYERASRIFHQDAISGVFRSPIAFFDTTPLGRMMNRFSRDTDIMDAQLSNSVQIFLSLFSGLIAYLGVMCYTAPFLLVVLAPIFVVYYFMQGFYLRTSRELKRLDAISRSPVYAHFSESMTGLSTIRAYQCQDRFVDALDNFINTNNQANYLQMLTQRWLGIRLELLGAIICFFTAFFSVYFSDSKFYIFCPFPNIDVVAISASLIGISLSYSLQVTSSLNFTTRQAAEIEVNANRYWL